MSIGNVNNNNAAQLQLYAQDKATIQKTAVSSQTQSGSGVTQPQQADSVQISEQARALFTSTIPGNGAGIEPPKTVPANTPVYSTLGNGAGIEPPKTGSTTDPSYNTLGNGAGIEPPKQ